MSVRSLHVIGLALSSSWGNGHATTWRALLKGLAAMDWRIVFHEWDAPWMRGHRDLTEPDFCELRLYTEPDDLQASAGALRAADLVMIGSYVKDGRAVLDWVRAQREGPLAFYDIDTPITLASLADDACPYLARRQLASLDLHASFTGGPALDALREAGARRVLTLPCGVDAGLHRPVATPLRWDLSYLGTYAEDRQAALERLLLTPARAMPAMRFCVAGAQYPDDIDWPTNVERIENVAPADHAAFYGASRFTLNLTRAAMIAAGHSPSVRLFEAAACGATLVSDAWPGLSDLFRPDKELFVADDGDDVIGLLAGLPEARRRAVGHAARRRVLRGHTGATRANALHAAYLEMAGG